MNGISKETFSKLDPRDQIVELFNIIHSIKKTLDSVVEDENTRIVTQVKLCRKQFVTRNQAVLFGVAITAFGFGAGFAAVKEITPVLVKLLTIIGTS